MRFHPLLPSLKSRPSLATARRSHRPRTPRLGVEALDDRCLPTTFTVTNLLDTGDGSLRAAVVAANANPGADAIDFATTGTIALTSGQLDITDSLTINGPGAGALTVSGNHASRVFGITGNPTVVIADLTVANGWTSGSPGGGITIAGGNLTLERVAVSGNEADGWPGDDGLGGGLYVAGGTLTLDQCIVSGNYAVGGEGGGWDDVQQDNGYFYSYGYAGGAAAGGGLYVAGGLVHVNQSTVSSNVAIGGRGASPEHPGDPTYWWTYGGNGGLGEGGGIYVAAVGKLEVGGSTLSGNAARGGGGGSGYVGGWSADGVGGGLYIVPTTPIPADLDTFTESHAIDNFADIDPNIAGPYSLNGASTQPSGFAVSGFPSATTAGVAGTFTVTATNADGTTATNYRGTVRFTSSDLQAVLPIDYTFTAADQGVHTFSATLKTAGTQAITARDTTATSVTGSETGITVNPAAASRFAVAGFPSPVTAGVAGNFTVTASDAYGNRAPGYTGTVHFTSSDPQAVLPPDYTFAAADAGMHTFTATLKTAGYQSLTATDTANADITGFEGNNVKSAAASRLVLIAPASVKANTAFSLTVTVVDAYGNVVTGYTGTLSFSSSDATANLPKKYTFTAADQGVHIFNNLRLKKKGKQTVTATITVSEVPNSTITGSVSIQVL